MPKFSKIFHRKTPRFSKEHVLYMPKISICNNQIRQINGICFSSINVCLLSLVVYTAEPTRRVFENRNWREHRCGLQYLF